MPRQQYKVVGHYVTVKTMTQQGSMVVGLHKGAPVPPDVHAAQIAHLLSVRLIAPVSPVPPVAPLPVFDPPGGDAAGDGDGGGVETAHPVPQPPPPVEETPPPEEVPAGGQADDRSPDGTPPNRRHSKAEWVDYAVSCGYSRTEAEAATKDELIALLTASSGAAG